MGVLEILALVAALGGLIGSVVPGLPGPPVSWVGMLLVYLAGRGGDEPMSLTLLLVWLGVTVAVTVIDYLVPVWMTKAIGGHKAASTGAILGLIAGMILPPVGMIVGAIAGAVIGELFVTDKGFWAAFKAGMGAFLGFMTGTGLKLITSGVMCWYIVKFVF